MKGGLLPNLISKGRATARSVLAAFLTAILLISAAPASALQPAREQQLPNGSIRIECLSPFVSSYPYPCAVGESIWLWPQVNLPEEAVSTYQWYADGKEIAGATNQSFVPSIQFKGRSISAVMTVSLGKQVVKRESNVLPPLLGPLAEFPEAEPTTISGTGLAGQPLTAVLGKYPSGTTFEYQWEYQEGVSILPLVGEVRRTFIPTPDLAGKPVSVRVVATKPGFRQRVTGFRGAVTVHKDVVSPPTIVWKGPGEWGPPMQGDILRVEMWRSGADISYQWNRDGARIPGAVSPTYKVTADDHGHRMSLTITGKMQGYPTASATSEETERVERRTLWPTELPTLSGYGSSGLFAVSGTARAVTGKWEPAATSFAYQWLSNGKPIAGATGPTYKIPQKLAGSMLSVRISASRRDYATYVFHTPSLPVAASDSPWPGPPSPAWGTFRDVPPSMQFSNEIEWMASAGISTGWPDNTYRPSQTVARDAMSAFMYRLAGSPAFNPPKASPFKDVVVKQQFYPEMSWLSKTGVSTGWPDGTYRPVAPVNRDAMAAFMYRLAGSPSFTPPKKSPFSDVSTNHPFYTEISWLASEGISTGWSQANGRKLFKPQEPVRRDAMAAFMYRLNDSGHVLLGSD